MLHNYLVSLLSSIRVAYVSAVTTAVFSFTARNPDREKRFLSIWAELKNRSATSRFNSQSNLVYGLVNIASSTCSLVLTKALLGYGAEINPKSKSRYVTPLRCAARRDSSEAAELIKLFLYQGADPELGASRFKLDISEERGAKNIAEWLGMSWNDLVQKVKLDRENGICPPEYR